MKKKKRESMWMDPKWLDARDSLVKTTSGWWLKWKRDNDDVPKRYWRCRDAFYDFERFEHPGGQDWLNITKGTDITELFESSHLNIKKVDKYLKKYRVDCRPKKLRKSPMMSFRKKGFYDTLRERAYDVLTKQAGGWGPTVSIRIMSDLLILMFLTCFAMSIRAGGSMIWAVCTGFTLSHVCGMAHNFFHQRDNWRMYAFDFSLLSSYEWRVSHCYSHHCYPNQIKDAEVIGLEPFYVFLPGMKKGGKYHFLITMIFSQIFNSIIFHSMLLMRFVDILIFRKQKFRIENLIPFIELMILMYLTTNGILIWNIIHASASWWFITMSLIGGTHHHPKVWHDGREQQKMNENDFGICQLRAVIDRPDVNSTLFTKSTMFGDHALHHLFPTVDVSRLHLLRDVLEKTCRDFNMDVVIHKKASFWECCKGFYRNMK